MDETRLQSQLADGTTMGVKGKQSRLAGDDARANAGIAVAATLLTVFLLIAGRYLIRFVSRDMTESYLLWYQHIVSFGRWRSVEGSWVNYNPPYLYNLSTFTWLNGFMSRVTIIKLASVPYLIGCGALFRSICLVSGCSKTRSNLAFWIALVAPEAAINTFQWGQCDIQSTAFVLLFARLLLARRTGWAMAAYGVALSFKLQAIFAGPVILALLLTGEIAWNALLAVPVSYVVMLLPARMAGRAFHSLLGVYGQQYGTYQSLTMGAANPYMLLEPWINHSETINAKLSGAALVLAAIALLGVTAWLTFSKPLLVRHRLIMALALSMTLSPFILPKMHDRYFFSGNMMVLLLMMVHRRMVLPAILSQAAAMLTYYPYLYHPYLDSTCETLTYWAAAVALNGASITLIALELRRSVLLGLPAEGVSTSGVAVTT